MSSTNKTPILDLNSWRGSDIPQMEDFNRDNVILDNFLGMHLNNSDIHITASERAKWNTPYYLFTYYGSGAVSRSVDIECDFEPTWGIIFGTGKTPDVTDFDNTSDYNYFGLVSTSGSTPGVALSGNQLSVTQSPISVTGNEYRNFNEIGVTYVVIMFA